MDEIIEILELFFKVLELPCYSVIISILTSSGLKKADILLSIGFKSCRNLLRMDICYKITAFIFLKLVWIVMLRSLEQIFPLHTNAKLEREQVFDRANKAIEIRNHASMENRVVQNKSAIYSAN